MREYKIGDIVIWIDKGFSDAWKENHGISLYGKIAQIIDINTKYNHCLLEFKENINGKDGYRRGKKGHCWWSKLNTIEYAIDHLKFKKWVKG